MSSRILIVDDEEIVIRSCLRILSGNRYVVDAMQDGWDALPGADARVRGGVGQGVVVAVARAI